MDNKKVSGSPHRIPAGKRLYQRIVALEMKVGLREPIGDGNPYYRCVYCHQSEPYIDIEGHREGCLEIGYLKEITHYRKLLKEVIERTTAEEDK